LIWIKSAAGHWLHCTDFATSIVSMLLSRSLRRLVASIVALAFLGCQGVALAHARSPDATGSGASKVAGSCHDAGQEPGDVANSNACQSNCQSLNTSSSSSGANVYAVTDFPAIAALVEPFVQVAGLVQPDEPLLRIESPPLSILHCCLRN